MWLHVLGYDHFIHCLLEQLKYNLISLVSLSSTSHALSSLCTSMDDPEIIVSLHADIEGDCYSLYTRRLSFNCGTCIGPSYWLPYSRLWYWSQFYTIPYSRLWYWSQFYTIPYSRLWYWSQFYTIPYSRLCYWSQFYTIPYSRLCYWSQFLIMVDTTFECFMFECLCLLLRGWSLPLINFTLAGIHYMGSTCDVDWIPMRVMII